MRAESVPQTHVHTPFNALPFWAKALHTISEAVLMVDQDEVLRYFNKASERLYGLHPENDINQPWENVLACLDWPASFLAELKEKTIAGESTTLVRHHSKPDGTLVLIEATVTPLFDAEEIFEGSLIVVNDRTEREETAQQLKTIREHWETVNAYLPLMIGRLDRTLRFQYCNPALAHQLDTLPSALVDTPLYQWLDRETFQQLHPKLLQAIGGEEASIELELSREGASRSSLQGNCIPVGDAGDLIIMLLDVSALKEAHQQLSSANLKLETEVSRRTAELQSSNRDLERFVFLASHDLQEPLRMIISYLQLMRRRSGDKFDTEDLEHFAFAENGAKRMKALLDALLFYSRFKRTETRMNAVPMDQIWAEVKDILRQPIAESQAQITEMPLPLIKGDEMQILHLLQNLLSNAVKFVKDKPPVLELSWKQEGEMAVFSLQDNGIGIQKEFEARIFEVFERLHTRDEFPGTGIGLSICKEVVENAGGKIWIESTLGEGTTFFFSLPMVE